MPVSDNAGRVQGRERGVVLRALCAALVECSEDSW